MQPDGKRNARKAAHAVRVNGGLTAIVPMPQLRCPSVCNQAACDLAGRSESSPANGSHPFFTSHFRSTMVKYAHAFREGTYGRQRALALRAGCGRCVPRFRPASHGTAVRLRCRRGLCAAECFRAALHLLLFLSIPLAHGFAPWCCDVSGSGAAHPQPAKSCAPSILAGQAKSAKRFAVREIGSLRG